MRAQVIRWHGSMNLGELIQNPALSPTSQTVLGKNPHGDPELGTENWRRVLRQEHMSVCLGWGEGVSVREKMFVCA